MVELTPNSSHLAGEYFVAGELYRRGYNVGMTIGNAKAIDMFAEKKDHIIAIQVKTVLSRKSGNWTIGKKDVKKNVVYIFVNLNNTEAPEYYICRSREVKEKIKSFKNRSGLYISKLRNDKYSNRWDKLK